VSRAFVKESDGSEADQDLPELRISPHRNFVTADGLAMIEAEVRRLNEARAQARESDDRAAAAQHSRDLRYWTARRATAEVLAHRPGSTTVRFGSRVTLLGDDGKSFSYRIVGEDEAAPADGRISYVSPLGTELLGLGIGDSVPFGHGQAEITAIS
jgi:transcription elongation GreA/GreB family factor